MYSKSSSGNRNTEIPIIGVGGEVEESTLTAARCYQIPRKMKNVAKIIESCNKTVYMLKALRSYRCTKVQNVGNRRIKQQLHSYEMSRCTKPSSKY